MCGFLGTFSNHDESLLYSSLELISHRGPDQTGSVEYPFPHGTLRFGFKRLSIQDLTSNGNQPFLSIDNRFALIFNGEIYNFHELRSQLQTLGYQFSSKCDTEVLLYSWSEWGLDCLTKLDGMFAFAVFDRITNMLTLARDPFGIKPLYYFNSSSELAFSSEINPILNSLALPRKLDFDVSLTYLFEGIYDRSQHTFYKNIKRLMPGYFIQFSLDTLKVVNHRPWYNPSLIPSSTFSYSQACEQFRHLFLESVRLQLRSDVSFGVTLSGGLDSSSVLSAVRHLDKSLPLSTYSYSPGSCPEDELKWINTMNSFSKATSNIVTVDSLSFNQNILSFIASQGEPVSSLSYFAEFSVYQYASSQGIKVMLDGHGADELLCGYSSYPVNHILSLLRSSDYLGLISYLNNWAAYPGRSIPQSLIDFILSFATSLGVNSDLIKSYLKQFSYRHLFSYSKYNRIINYDLLSSPLYSHSRPLMDQLRIDLTISSSPPQLRSADRSAMFSSIENRVPFLSPKLSDFVFSLPEHFLSHQSGASKQLMRDSLVGIVPQVILDRKDKIGYKTPDSLRLSITPDLFDRIYSSLSLFPFLHRDNVLDMLFEENKTLSTSPISWRIFNFLLWADISHTSL